QVEHRQRQEPQVDEAPAPAGGAVEDRIERLQQDASVKDDEDHRRDPAHGQGEAQVRRADAEDVSKEEVPEVNAGRQLAYERDARREEQDEEGAERGVLLDPRQAAEERAPEGREEAGGQPAEEEGRRACPEEHPGRGDAREPRMREGVAHERKAAQDQDAPEKAPAHPEEHGRDEAPAHELVRERRDQDLVDRAHRKSPGWAFRSASAWTQRPWR